MNNILEVSNLNKHYNNFDLTDLSFSLPDGCITGFIGTNGAGKTTTIRSILGLANRSSGSIKIFGVDMDRNHKKLKNRIGVVLGDGCFYDELSMNEMKSVIAPAYSSWNETEYKNYMECFSLNPKQKISTLSKGMRIKYALVLALSHRAELLIMDEPTSGLDPLIRSQLMDILTDYMKKDVLIIKKYVYIMMGFSILIPLFIVWRIPKFSTLGFIFSVTFTELILCQYLFMKEHEYSKASGLLCAAPYPRWMLVASKYLFLIIIYILCGFIQYPGCVYSIVRATFYAIGVVYLISCGCHILHLYANTV